jgi:adenine deaminase
MRILIREGSAAKNFEALHPLISEFPDMVMLCSDDKHPGDLAAGHINLLVKRALDSGHSLINVLKCAILNPMFHYGLDTGLLREGDPADFIVVDNPRELNILKTYINGTLVAEDGRSRIESVEVVPVNNFNIGQKDPSDFVVMAEGMMIRVIEAIDNEIITKEHMAYPKTEDGFVVADTENDILKIAVVNRYEESKPAIGFIKNFGLKRGAIATSVAHDSHNIIAVGTNDRDISAAVNEVIRNRGGMAAADSEGILSLSLPVAGLMSSEEGIKVAHNYELVEKKAKAMGSTLSSPFMTLSFMALLVIPKLKLSDKGLFDGEKFGFTNLFV